MNTFSRASVTKSVNIIVCQKMCLNFENVEKVMSNYFLSQATLSLFRTSGQSSEFIADNVICLILNFVEDSGFAQQTKISLTLHGAT